jgi:hypothetical protein
MRLRAHFFRPRCGTLRRNKVVNSSTQRPPGISSSGASRINPDSPDVDSLPDRRDAIARAAFKAYLTIAL